MFPKRDCTPERVNSIADGGLCLGRGGAGINISKLVELLARLQQNTYEYCILSKPENLDCEKKSLFNLELSTVVQPVWGCSPDLGTNYLEFE